MPRIEQRWLDYEGLPEGLDEEAQMTLQGSANEDIDEENELRTQDVEREKMIVSISRYQSMTQVARASFLRFWIAVRPSPFSCSVTEHKSKKSTQLAYLDGLRGIAAFIVYIDHFSAPHFDQMLDSFGSTARDTFILQLPVVRLIYTGGPMVCIFFAISGTVLSIKPLALLNSLQWTEAYETLASYLFRRPIRLYLPTTIATLFIMVLVQFGVEISYPISQNPDLIRSRPIRFSLPEQIKDWVTSLLTRLYYPATWFPPHHLRTEADYCPPLWTIPIEFYSSMVLLLMLTTLARTRASIRRCVIAVSISYCFYIQRWDLAMFLSGSLIADSIQYSIGTGMTARTSHTSTSSGDSRNVNFRKYLLHAFWCLLLIMALVIMSYTSIHGTSKMFAPLEAMSHSRWTWEAIGSALLVFCITKLRFLQRFLETPVPQYLGKISYSLYIVHFPLLGAGGWSLLPWIWRGIGEESWRAVTGYVLAFCLVTPIVLWISDIWNRIVDDNCVRFGRWLEKVAAVELEDA